MKKTFLKFGAFILAGSLLVACKKDDDATPNKPEFPTQFSDLTVEQNKENLEDNGIELVNSLNSIKDTDGIQTMIAFSEHLSDSDMPDHLENGRVKESQGMRLIHLLSSFGKGNATGRKTLAGLRTKEGDFVSFADEFENAKGIYTYDKETDSWTYEDTGDKIVFRFPSTKEGTTANAEYSMFGYTGANINSELGGDYEGDYPTGLKAELKVNNAVKMSFSFSAKYNGNGDPSQVAVSFTIDAYKFAYNLTNTTSKVAVDYTLTQGSTTLLALGASATGTFSTNAVSESEGPEDVVTEASGYFQIINIKFSGLLDVQGLNGALSDDGIGEQELVDALNENYKLMVYYADTKQKIADSEFYVASREECYYDWGIEEEVCEEVAAVDVRMVFADGSKSDLETYTDEGFQDLQDELESFVDSIEEE